MSNRFRRLTDLFVVGKPVPLADGTYLWVQALNSYQRDECISDAQVARARVVLALRDNGDEKLKVEARFFEQGRDKLITDLSEHRASTKVGEYLDELRDDPDWKERMDILMRTNPDESAKPITAEEVTLLSDINAAVIAEMTRREEGERDFLSQKLHRLSDEELISEWTDEWLERRGTDLAAAEFRLTEMWYATRYCAGALIDDVVDHAGCDGHREQVFTTRAEARMTPDDLMTLITTALADLNVAGRDPKGSASAGSSSDSSPAPNEPEASTASTSTETPKPPPGT